MKKLLFPVLALMLCIPPLSAQNKGDKYVGGIIGITTTSISIDGSSASQTTFGFAPEFGYFASDRLRVGGSIGYQLISSDGETTHGLTAGPSLAYYVRLCDRFYYTPQLAVGFAFASTDGTSGYGFDAGLSLGAFEIRPSAHIGLSVSLLTLGYSYLSYSGTGVNGVSFQLGISPTVGFEYYF